MVAETLRLRVITPRELKIDEEVGMVIMHCPGGDMGVLPGHDYYVVQLDYGSLRYHAGDAVHRMAVFGGVAEIKDDVVTVITSGALWPWEANRAEAEAEREQIERRMLESDDAMELQRDQVLLRRALVQMEVASETLISKPDWQEKD